MQELQPYQQQPHLWNLGTGAILHLEGEKRIRQGCEDEKWGAEGGGQGKGVIGETEFLRSEMGYNPGL